MTPLETNRVSREKHPFECPGRGGPTYKFSRRTLSVCADQEREDKRKPKGANTEALGGWRNQTWSILSVLWGSGGANIFVPYLYANTRESKGWASVAAPLMRHTKDTRSAPRMQRHNYPQTRPRCIASYIRTLRTCLRNVVCLTHEQSDRGLRGVQIIQSIRRK